MASPLKCRVDERFEIVAVQCRGFFVKYRQTVEEADRIRRQYVHGEQQSDKRNIVFPDRFVKKMSVGGRSIREKIELAYLLKAFCLL
jgi:hypothetical protein